jgi:lipopolysaccharide export system permease protein
MAKTNPRQGRYAKLVPSILLYMLYLTLLTSAKGKMEDGDLPLFTLWLIHAAFLSLALSMLFAGHFWESFMNRLPSMPSFKRSKS